MNEPESQTAIVVQNESQLAVGDPESILRFAIERGAGVDVMERLLVMHEKMKASRAKEAFDTALADFQAKCPIIVKMKDGYNKAYKYAPLDEIVSQTRAELRSHGFSFTLTGEVTEGWVQAVIKVTHVAGHSENSQFKCPIDNNQKNLMTAPQRYGAAMTFAKRYCLHPETLTLDSHLQWRPIGDVVVGDRLIAFDEVAKLPKRRCFRVAEVLSVKRVFLPAFRIVFEDRTVIASGDHMWLHGRHRSHRTLPNVCEVCGKVFSSPKSAGIHRRMSHGITREFGGWMRTETLAKGSLIRNFGKPWKKDNSRGAGYLAGVFDGEASLWPRTNASSGLQISFSQKAGAVLDYTQELMRERGFHARLSIFKSDCHQLLISGSYDVMRFLGSVTPIRLHVRAADWIDGQGAKSKIGPEPAKVLDKEFIGETELVSIETSTGTLFAEGLFSHNCFCNAFGILTSDEDIDARDKRTAPKMGPQKKAAESEPETAPDPAAEKAADRLRFAIWKCAQKAFSGDFAEFSQWLYDEGILSDTESTDDMDCARLERVLADVTKHPRLK